ncbi:rod shape-determining protein [Nonomuraea terrae]|uniref:rod shape-determining protein n=1 Tax=Nonomuraea terrae TaxID=2530383 RepID=UPI0037B2FD4C
MADFRSVLYDQLAAAPPHAAVLPGGLVALDLGTARTRSLSSDGNAIVERPSALGGTDPVRPLRHGMVADPAACLRLVRLALRDTGVAGGRALERVLAGVPVAATRSDRRAVRAAVSEAAGCAVTLVDEPLAAAVGAGLDVTAPCLLLDVGAGVVEAAAIRDGVIADAAALQLEVTTRAGLPPYALEGVVEMTAGLVRRLPEHLRPAVRTRGLVVTGGGARQAELLRRLHAALRVRVEAAQEPQYATVRGLMRLCLLPDPVAGGALGR